MCRGCNGKTYTPTYITQCKPRWPYIFCKGCYKPAWMCDCPGSNGDRNPDCTEWWETAKRVYLPGVTYDRP